MNVEWQDMTPEEIEQVEKIGYTTAWKLQQKYGIPKDKTSRAIKANKLMAFMKYINGERVLKWYILKNKMLEEYVEKNKKWDDPKIEL